MIPIDMHGCPSDTAKASCPVLVAYIIPRSINEPCLTNYVMSYGIEHLNYIPVLVQIYILNNAYRYMRHRNF